MNVRVIPDHVPAELVFDFDYTTATHNVPDPYAPLMDLDARGVPDFFFTPGGSLGRARRYDTIREIFQNHERFTTFPIVIPPIKDQPTQMIPLQVDPPDHQRYRRLMGPLYPGGRSIARRRAPRDGSRAN
jgi:cytochrome P450